MANNEQLLKYDENIGLYDHINPILNLKDLNRKQTKELAKEIANNESQTHSWQEVLNDAVNYDSKNKRQEKRFKRIFNKQLNENLAPILEKQHKQELIDRMKSGDASAMSQWTTEGINKFGHQFMPVMLTAATLPFGIGAFGQAANTIGLLPAVTSEVASTALGHGGYKLGEKLDDSFGTNYMAPIMGIGSGMLGYGAGYKGMVKAGSKGWLPKGDKFMYGSQFVGDVAADGIKRGIKRGIRTTPEVSTIDRTVGIQNRVFAGDPIFPKTTWQIPAFNTNSAYRLTGQSQIDDMMQTGFVRPRSGKIKGGHTNEVHWSAGNAKSGYNIQPGQYVLESQRGLVDGTTNAIGVNDLSHIWTVRNGQVVDVIDEIRPHMRTVDSPSSPKGSYVFYERPSQLSIAERMGIPKGDRAILTQDQLEGLEDLMHYNTSGKYRWHLTYNDETGFARTTAANRPEGSVPGVKALLDHGATSRGYENAPVDLRTKTGSWTIWPGRKNSPAKFSGGDFPTPEGMGWAPGDLSLMLDGNTGKGLKVVMTSPRVDLANSLEDASRSLIESLPNTIDKNIMRRFWQNNDQVVLPGSYLSGDNGTLPLGLNGISAIDQGKGMSGAISEILHPTRFRPHASGLSPDSMLSILKQGQRPRHAVRYGPGFTQLNDSAVYNKHIYDAWTKYKSGAITADEFKTIFDDWFVPQGGRPLEIRTPNKFRWARNNDGTKTLVQQDQTPYIVFPHPYVHYKKLGGKIENGK